jgi:O-antigen/teichoic acid export membrane protein
MTGSNGGMSASNGDQATANGAGSHGAATSGGEGKNSYASGARILSIGIASTGIFTFAYLAAASHDLDKQAYGRITLCWAIMFVILSVIYRPVEQLLSRMIADRRARGLHGHPLRVPAMIQGGFALTFLVAALALRPQIENDLFDGSSALYWILVVGVLAYAASYFARGWLAGHERFALYGGLVFLESTSRFLFALAVAVGIGSGQGVVGLGMAVAPFVSLMVMPFAFSRVRHPAPAEIPIADAAREGPAHAAVEEASADVSLKHGTGFAVAVVGIMLAEQTLMNAAVLIVNHSSGVALAGFVFNVLLIVRAPLQLFQAIQTSILPHLAGLEARESAAEFHRAIRVTVLAITAFASACAIGLLAIGPWVMTALLGDKGFHYGRVGLAIVAIGMGLHLVSGTLNQAALARGRARLASICWLIAAALFVVFVATPTISDEVLRVEVGYFLAALLLCGLLYVVYRQGPAAGVWSKAASGDGARVRDAVPGAAAAADDRPGRGRAGVVGARVGPRRALRGPGRAWTCSERPGRARTCSEI